jgi:RHS repeat-associated protein
LYLCAGSLIYSRNSSGGLVLKSTGFGGGRITATTGGYEVDYQITDHLGSPRVVFTSRGNIVARNDFYAFGKRAMNNLLPAGNDTSNRFLYNGKEKLITGNIGFLDYGARMYDSEIARMMTPDPLGYLRSRESSFAFSANNPVNFIDPDGRQPIRPIGGSTILNSYRIATDKEYRQMVWRNFKTVLTFTDLNDIAVVGSAIVTTFTGGEARHIDGTIATSEDIDMAKNGLFLPAVSGSAFKKVGDAVDKATGMGRKLDNAADAGSQAVKREPAAKSREKWESATGEKWPKDPANPTRNQDVSHKKPLADGGTNEVDNIEPKPHQEHIQEHKDNGDFRRWGKRRYDQNQ